MDKTIQSIPEARLLLSSLRSVGYTEETAIADIIDNCISAHANEIDVVFDWDKKRILIIDNGLGMNGDELIENMRIGSSDPDVSREENDLGRFGMGMKTAAFSLGKRLTVVTKSNSFVSNAVWDLDQIPIIGWNLIIRSESEIQEYASMLKEQGTIVIIEDLDRVIDFNNEAKSKQKFYSIIKKVERHIALIFHRFIEEDDMILRVNGSVVSAWNPFIIENSATQELPDEIIWSDDGSSEIIIQPYVLPHKTKFTTDEDYQVAGGYKGWNYHQGIYVYRNRRLIIFGTWFDYIKKEPAYNLARIKIDITSASDEDWKIDIKKSAASLPVYVRDTVERAIDICTETSARVYNSRGTYSKSNVSTPNLNYVWEQRKRNYDIANFFEHYETSRTATRANSKYMADYIRTMATPGIGGVKNWTVCLINISNGQPFEIAGLENIGGGIRRNEGYGVDSSATTCSIHTMTSADHEYFDYTQAQLEEVDALREKYKNDPSITKVNEKIRRETRPFEKGLLLLYPIAEAGELTKQRGLHKPPFGFAAVFPDRKGKGNLVSYRMNEIALEKDNNEFYG